MVRRVKAPTRNPFLATDGVATRLAIRELKKAKVDTVPLLAKAGISLLKFGEEPKRVGAESGTGMPGINRQKFFPESRYLHSRSQHR